MAAPAYTRDYYTTLQIKRNATVDDITAAFRRQALIYHPSKSKGDTMEQFREMAEAYTVLKDDKLRAIFDQYGEATLKLGALDAQGERTGGWSFTQDPDTIFNEFFGSSNPYSDYYSKGDKLGFSTGFKPPKKAADITVNLFCSLEELFAGCKKRVAVVKSVMNQDGKGTKTVEVVKAVAISPGWKEGTKVTFRKEGNQDAGVENGDLIFLVKQLPDPNFERKGSNLIFNAKITLSQALTGCIVDVPMLDGKTKSITVEQVVSPGFTIRVAGQGMPKAKNPSARGDLIVAFNVAFPTALSEKQKKQVREILG